MQCEQFEQVLMQQDEAAVPKTALSHMESCEACRSLSADFNAIHEMAMELGAEGIAPPERVWVSLRNQLEAEGLIRGPQATSPSADLVRRGWWTAFQRPAFAGAFLGMVLAAASVIGYWSNAPQSTAQYSQLAPQQET